MTRDTRKVWTYWLIAFFTIAIIRLLSGCAPMERYTPVIPAHLDHLSGLTNCDLNDEPVIYLDTTTGDKTWMHYTLIHERIHAAWANAYPGGCREFLKRYKTDSAYKFDVEAAAYCGAYEARVRDGVATKADWQYMSEQILRYAVGAKKVPCKPGG